jgi:hypothetical protein
LLDGERALGRRKPDKTLVSSYKSSQSLPEQSATMAEPVARIRPFQASDDKVVRFAIGKANMESLAVANRRGSHLSLGLFYTTRSAPISSTGYVHPFTIVVFFVLSYISIHFMNMWPTNTFGFLGYLQPLPLMAATAVPIMAFIDW